MKSMNFPEEIKDKLSKLTKKELKYFKCMWPKSGVLYIQSEPGIGKSATIKSIAEKLGFEYFDIRLSMVDETDVGLFPSLENIEGIKCLDFAIPRWAFESNKGYTIIHFEELNRANKHVRDAALQILLERAIGTRFKFNDNVLMIASGNLGEEDNTDVEEFDEALNGRLIHMKHTMSYTEWCDSYANENIHSSIINFISAYPEYYYKRTNDDNKNRAYCSPRSWTFLSDYIVSLYGKDAAIDDFIDDLKIIASSYVGPAAVRFLTYCEDLLKISIMDVINDYDGVKEQLKQFNRDKNSELIQNLKGVDVSKLGVKELNNIKNFLNDISEDEAMAYLMYLVDNTLMVDISEMSIQFIEFLKSFKELLSGAFEINESLNGNSK